MRRGILSGSTGGMDYSLSGRSDEAYFDDDRVSKPRAFDTKLLQEPVTVLSTRSPRRRTFTFWKKKFWDNVANKIACPVMKAAAKIVVPHTGKVTSDAENHLRSK